MPLTYSDPLLGTQFDTGVNAAVSARPPVFASGVPGATPGTDYSVATTIAQRPDTCNDATSPDV